MALLNATARWLGMLLLAVMIAGRASAQPAGRPEYQVKAVFLFNFTLFAQWPPEAFAQDTSPLVIGVVGDDPFGRFLDEAVRGEKVGSRAVIVQRARQLEDLPTCHVLFVSQSEAPRLTQVLAAARARSILTVSDIEGFTAAGGMIRFLREGGKVRLRINVDAAKAAGVTLSSTLLRSAEIVTTQAK